MNNNIKFTKMHGAGNDFIILEIDNIPVNSPEIEVLAKKMCDRNFGIGGDGLILVNPCQKNNNADISWRILNSDGSEPQMCGNGIRCFAKYVYEKGIISKKKFSVSTLAGIIIPEILDNGKIKVDMGYPILEPIKIPVNIDNLEKVIAYPFEIQGRKYEITVVSMGNPHCVIFTKEDPAYMAKEIGPFIEKASIFPEKTNVEFVKILSKNKITVDVWERGCGITLACGTGACASTVAAVLNNLTGSSLTAILPGGELEIEWDKLNTNKIFMTGSAEFVFEGEYIVPR